MSSGVAGVGAVWEIHVDFEDGNPDRKKYFVVLNDCDDVRKTIVAAFTTSQDRYGFATGKQCGCPEKPCYRVEPRQVASFPKQTWIQFDNIHPMTLTQLRAFEAKGTAKFLETLPVELTRSLLNCAKKSDDTELVLIELVEKAFKRLEHERDKAKATPSPLAEKPLAVNPSKGVGGKAQRYSAASIREELSRSKLNPSDFYGLLGIPEAEIDEKLAGSEGHAVAENVDAAFQLLKTSKEPR